jgi:hypothetical protein
MGHRFFERLLVPLGNTTLRPPYRYPSGTDSVFKGLPERLVQFDELKRRLHPTAPRLLVSAAAVETGEFRVFRSHGVGDIKPPARGQELLKGE